MNDGVMLNVGGESVSLLDVAGINMDGVDAVRFTRTAAGFFVFQIKDAKLGTIGKDDNKKFAAQFELEIKNVISLKDEKETADKWVGKTHNENFTISGENMLEDIGRIKAFFEDTGFKGSGNLEQLLQACKGHLFQGQVTHRPDKNDKDTIYANINRDPKVLKPFDPAAV